ncbi:MAG: thioredoxin family protein [Bacteroidota bacterium]
MRLFSGLVTGLILLTVQGFAQTNDTSTNKVNIQWMDMETAIEKQKQAPKTIFVDLYTDWCGWCKKMDKETFNNPDIARYINQNFYPVKFDAEGKDTIDFFGKTYVNKGEGRRPTHELALLFTNNKPSYPSLIFIDENGKPNQVPGFMDAKKIEPILVFFAERVYKTCDFDYFHKAYKAVYRHQDSINIDTSGNINWVELDEALLKQTQDEKKILFFFYSDSYQPITSELMRKINFQNPHIAAYINNNYHPVFFDAARTDTINMFNQTFINEQKAPGYPHQFVFALLQKKVIFPSVIFLNNDGQLIAPMQGYYNPATLEPYLHYIATDAYQDDKNYQEYYQNFEGKLKKKE